MELTSGSDDSLLAQARSGNLDALDGLVRRHQSWIFNLALRMVWRRETAEDATQEILIKAVTNLSAMEAGVQGYFAFLRGKRVTYFGRQGDQHTEWFPGSAPSSS